jgi:hypothetical protein
MTSERGMHLPLLWRGQKERYNLSGKLLELQNPGKVVVFQGSPFHLNPDGSLVAFTDEERRKFVLNKPK